MNLIQYATDVEGKVEDCDQWLQAVFFFAASMLWAACQKRFLITSVYRPDNKKSVHAWWKGIDVDVCDGFVYDGGVTPQEAEAICRMVNGAFKYDPARPDMFCAVYGWRDEDGGHDDHIHFQVCDNTERVC